MLAVKPHFNTECRDSVMQKNVPNTSQVTPALAMKSLLKKYQHKNNC